LLQIIGQVLSFVLLEFAIYDMYFNFINFYLSANAQFLPIIISHSNV